MNKWYKLTLAFTFVSFYTQAQEFSNSRAYTDLLDTKQINLKSENPAFLQLDSLIDRGSSTFSLLQKDGSYHLVQDGDKTKSISVSSQGIKKAGNYIAARGNFNFNQGRIYNKAWNDFYRSEHSDPYIAGSSVSGEYASQDISLTADLATIKLKNFTYGIRVDYNVGDLSRLKDPRSRVSLADYFITPGVTYSFGNNTLGVSGKYRRRKERLLGLSTVDADASFMYYQMTGLEHTNAIQGGHKGFGREFVDNEFSAQMSYGYKTENFETLNEISVATAEENVYENYKYEPGTYFWKEYKLASFNRIKTEKLYHVFDFNVNFKPAFADQYKSQLKTSKDPETGIESKYYEKLITYGKRYETSEIVAGLHYKALWYNDLCSKAYLGAIFNYSYNKDEYHLPESYLEEGGFYAGAEFGISVFQKNGHSLFIDTKGGYYSKLKSVLFLDDFSTDYAVEVLIPNMEYYGASFVKGNLSITYQFPVSIKGSKLLWFVKTEGSYLSSNKSTDAYSAGLSIGVYY